MPSYNSGERESVESGGKRHMSAGDVGQRFSHFTRDGTYLHSDGSAGFGVSARLQREIEVLASEELLDDVAVRVRVRVCVCVCVRVCVRV